MSEKIIRDITQNCPNIIRIIFWRIRGVKSLEISKLPKLKCVTIGFSKHCREIERIFVEAPALLSFMCHYIQPCVIDMSSCCALNSLRLEECQITDDEFNAHMSRLPLLENLDLLFCNQLRRVRISLPRLKFLSIDRCREIESILIDTPTLSKLTYNATIDKFPLVTSNFVHSDVDLIYKLHAPYRSAFDSSKFVDLRRFLKDLNLHTNLKLSFLCDEISFDSELLGEVESRTVVEVDHLKLKCVKAMDASRSAFLLGGLLWSCHPKVISFSKDEDVQNNLQKVLCEKLLRSEDRSCCNGRQSMCWHHGLKAAKITFNGDLSWNGKSSGIEYQQLRLALDRLSISQANRKVEFMLEWDVDRKDKTVIASNEEQSVSRLTRTRKEAPIST